MRDGLLKTVPLDPAFHRGFGKALENIRGQLYVATLAVELENAVRSSRGNEALIEIRSSESRVRTVALAARRLTYRGSRDTLQKRLPPRRPERRLCLPKVPGLDLYREDWEGSPLSSSGWRKRCCLTDRA